MLGDFIMYSGIIYSTTTLVNSYFASHSQIRHTEKRMARKTGNFKKKTDKARAKIAHPFGDLLKQRRIELGNGEITQEALAGAMETTRGTVGNIENGTHFPMLDTLYVYMETLQQLATGKGFSSWQEAFYQLFKRHGVPEKFDKDDLETHRSLAKILNQNDERAAAIRLLLEDEAQMVDLGTLKEAVRS